jgi:glycosyltransferase involved in cell wall biosynthesis
MGQLDKAEYYERLDEIALFVIASELEPFGLVVADALNCHCSILMSHNVGAAGIMQTREEDFVDNPHDTAELARCIQHLMEHPNAERLLSSVDVHECSDSMAWEKMKNLCYSI